MKRVTKKGAKQQISDADLNAYFMLLLSMLIILFGFSQAKANDFYSTYNCSILNSNELRQTCDLNNFTDLTNPILESDLKNINQTNLTCIQKYNECKKVCSGNTQINNSCESIITSYAKKQVSHCAQEGLIGQAFLVHSGSEEFQKARVQCENFRALANLKNQNNNNNSLQSDSSGKNFWANLFNNLGFGNSINAEGVKESPFRMGDSPVYQGHQYVPAEAVEASQLEDSLQSKVNRVDERFLSKNESLTIKDEKANQGLTHVGTNNSAPIFGGGLNFNTQTNSQFAKSSSVKKPTYQAVLSQSLTSDEDGDSYYKIEPKDLGKNQNIENDKNNKNQKQNLINIIQKSYAKTRDPILKAKYGRIINTSLKAQKTSLVNQATESAENIFESISELNQKEF